MDSQKKTLTVFTPAYNRGYTIHKCYESLRRQTLKDFVWLVVDDGSTDNTAQLIKETKESGKRVIAVGTTSCRTLESVADKYGEIIPCDGFTDIFIYPGFKFKVLDGLVTNFHLPESTLIMLVSAFCGYENTMNFYKTAVEEKYRFFSFGDSMFLTNGK